MSVGSPPSCATSNGWPSRPLPTPLVTLWAEWNGLRDVRSPDGLDDDEAETFSAETGDRMTVLEDRITATPPRSFAAALAQISVLIFRAEAGVPHAKDPTLVDLQKGVETTLQGIAA